MFCQKPSFARNRDFTRNRIQQIWKLNWLNISWFCQKTCTNHFASEIDLKLFDFPREHDLAKTMIYIVNKGKAAIISIWPMFSRYKIFARCSGLVKIFNSMVRTILLYRAHIWCLNDKSLDRLDNVLMFFLKKMLKLPSGTIMSGNQNILFQCYQFIWKPDNNNGMWSGRLKLIWIKISWFSPKTLTNDFASRFDFKFHDFNRNRDFARNRVPTTLEVKLT